VEMSKPPLRDGDGLRQQAGVAVDLVRYIGDPDGIDHWPRPRLHANNGSQASHQQCDSQLLSQMPSTAPFHSLQVLLCLATQ
jgi:hypothetical protein